jgi:YHS domain-containing protein
MNCKKELNTDETPIHLERKTKEGKFIYNFCSERCLNEFVCLKSIKVEIIEEENVRI